MARKRVIKIDKEQYYVIYDEDEKRYVFFLFEFGMTITHTDDPFNASRFTAGQIKNLYLRPEWKAKIITIGDVEEYFVDECGYKKVVFPEKEARR